MATSGTPGSAESAIWPTRGWGTSAQPRTSHGIADHEWRCWPLHKNAMAELAHIGIMPVILVKLIMAWSGSGARLRRDWC
jgi:hypothetical protein